MVHKVDAQLLRNGLTDRERTTRYVARYSNHGHVCPPYPLRSDTSIGRLAQVCQGLVRNVRPEMEGARRACLLDDQSPRQERRVEVVPERILPRRIDLSRG